MLKCLKLLTLLLFPLLGWCQSNFRIVGKVIDSLTGQALQGASVFCQNTTIGTVTNAEGEFRLNLSNGGYDLIISFMGFETESVRISNTMPETRNPIIALRQKEKSLETIAIVATNEVEDGWEKYGSFLMDHFIGKTENSKSCVIENPEVLRFFYSRKKKRLKVTGDSVLTITNKALGYIIKYQLDSFVHEYDNGKTLYAGYPFYEQMDGTEEEMDSWQKKRKIAYNGSVLQFLRAYHDSTLNGDGYRIELISDGSNSTSKIYNPYDEIYYDTLDFNRVELFFPGKLRIAYTKEKPEPAYLLLNKLSKNTPVQVSILDLANGIVVEENGYYYDQKDVLTLGYWSWEKMADFLPYDFHLETNTIENMKACLTPQMNDEEQPAEAVEVTGDN